MKNQSFEEFKESVKEIPVSLEDLNNPELKDLTFTQISIIGYLRQHQLNGKYYSGGVKNLCNLFRIAKTQLFEQLKELKDLGIINSIKNPNTFNGNGKDIMLIKYYNGLPVRPSIKLTQPILPEDPMSEVFLNTVYGNFKIENDLVDYYMTLIDKPGAMKKLKTSPSQNILNHRIREKKENEIIINIPGLN